MITTSYNLYWMEIEVTRYPSGRLCSVRRVGMWKYNLAQHGGILDLSWLEDGWMEKKINSLINRDYLSHKF